MLKNLNEDAALKFKNLSAEEKASRGILGRLYGPVATFTGPTRNGRKYGQELWEKLFNSDLIKERFKNGGIFGQLCHPDYSEVDMEKIAVVMPEPPVKDKDGQLVAYLDIVDTPCGRIAYQLAKYGYKFGISSRGEGDLVTDYDGNESVDPDTYTLSAFDLVEIPAVENARLAFVESLDKTRYNKTLRASLQESLNKASEADRKIMLETLDNLKINLSEDSEDLNEEELDEDSNVWDNHQHKEWYYLMIEDNGSLRPVLQNALKPNAKNISNKNDRFERNADGSIKQVPKVFRDTNGSIDTRREAMTFLVKIAPKYPNKIPQNVVVCTDIQRNGALPENYTVVMRRINSIDELKISTGGDYMQLQDGTWKAKHPKTYGTHLIYIDGVLDTLWHNDGDRSEGGYTNNIEEALSKNQVVVDYIPGSSVWSKAPKSLLFNIANESLEEDFDDLEFEIGEPLSEAYNPYADLKESLRHGYQISAYVNGTPVEKIILAPSEEEAKEKFIKLEQGNLAKTPEVKQLSINPIPDEKYAEVVRQIKSRNKNIQVESLTLDEEHCPHCGKEISSFNTDKDNMLRCPSCGMLVSNRQAKEADKYQNENFNIYTDTQYESSDEDIIKELRNRLIDINKAVENGDDPERWSKLKERIFNQLDELKANYYDESLNINEAQNTAVDNNEAMVEELQKALKAKSDLNAQLIELQEKLSVCYAKEAKIDEEVEKYKTSIRRLAEESKKAVALGVKVKSLESTVSKFEQHEVSLQEQLANAKQKLEEATSRSAKLTEGYNKRGASVEQLSKDVKALTAQLSEAKAKAEKDKISLKESAEKSKKSLTETFEKERKQLTEKFEKEKAALNESIAKLQEEAKTTKESYSQKLEKSNKLVEKYKKATNTAIDKYIELQAIRLGASANEIKNKLPESYSFKDIDAVCEDLQDYKLNLSKLPFSSIASRKPTNESITIKGSSSKNESILPANGMLDDDIDDDLLYLAGN